jgi:DNA-binding TFAR19-related protein (PDSD5 family)
MRYQNTVAQSIEEIRNELADEWEGGRISAQIDLFDLNRILERIAARIEGNARIEKKGK